jgi:diaminohydroxyphosphoribosylaminopyrimidine deaminase/5-amino-6-(5-phosphoribosylamino)uracil reductase
VNARAAFVSPFSQVLDGELPPQGDDEDLRLLALALSEGERGVGRTNPNPPVGCVIARDGKVLAKGHHQVAGGPHAEVMALDRARGEAYGATAYITLEPCAHHGRTPPCVDRLLDEGVARVLVGTRDPNPEVKGRGLAKLRRAGVEAELAPRGPLIDRCRALIAPFGRVMEHGRPWIVAKVATTLDGRVATAEGHARWVTGSHSRQLVHALRDRVDAILVGAGTAFADDPRLTSREVPNQKSPRNPLRVIVDGPLRTPTDLRAYRRQRGDTRHPHAVVAHGKRAPRARRAEFDAANIPRLASGAGRHVDLGEVFSLLASEHGVTSVLVEPGPELFGALLRERLVDEVWWFTAPKVLGGDATAAVGALGAATMDDALELRGATARGVGEDMLVVGRAPS